MSTDTDAKIMDREYDMSTPLGAVQRTTQMRFGSAKEDVIRQARGVIRDMERLIEHALGELHVSTGGIGQQGDRLTEYVARYEQAAETVRELEWLAGKLDEQRQREGIAAGFDEQARGHNDLVG